MAKAVLVVDKQDSCWGCPLEYDNMGICILAENGVIEHGVIQRGKNCPARLVPTLREHEVIMYKIGQPLTDELAEELIDFGFNECLYDMELVEDEKETEMD